MGRRESGYFSAFVESEKVSYGVDPPHWPHSERKGGAGDIGLGTGDILTRYHTSPRNACTLLTMCAVEAGCLICSSERHSLPRI